MEELVNFKPAEQRVLILPDEIQDEIRKSGIIIPGEVKKDKPRIATIMATGKGDADNPMKYTIGQRVLISDYSGVEVELTLVGTSEVKTYKVVNQIDIMGVIEEYDKEEVGNESI